MRFRSIAIGAAAAVGAVLAATATAWACVSGPSITLNTANAKPGQEVTATLRDFRKADPIQIRWNALDGPVIATATPDVSGSPFQAKFTVPDTAKAGSYVVIFSQSGSDGKLTQLPVRALLNVTSATGSAPVVGAPVGTPETGRPAGLVTTDNSVSTGTFLLVALGVAGIGMFFVGVAAITAGRKGPAPAAAPARK